MADFTYKNVTVTEVATLEEAKQQAATAYLMQFGEPTQEEIDTLIAEIEDEQAENLDFSNLEADITNELTWITDTLATIDVMTQVQVRNVVKRILQEQQKELKAWRYVIRKLGG